MGGGVGGGVGAGGEGGMRQGERGEVVRGQGEKTRARLKFDNRFECAVA